MTSMWQGRNYINGKFVKHEGEVYSNLNPSTGTSLGDFPQSDYETRLAVNAAREAFLIWKRKSRIQRAEYFYKISQIIERRKREISKRERRATS